MSALISLDSIVDSLRFSIPDAEWFLRQIESEQGWFRFPPYLANVITLLKIEDYPLLYANEEVVRAVILKGFLTDEEIKILCSEAAAATPEELGKFVSDSISSVSEALDQFHIPQTLEEQEAAQKTFLALPEEEQMQAIKFSQYFFLSFFTNLFQNLSIMVHGEKLTSLVTQAVAGNDDAFAKAVQIDRRILTEFPYFRERFARAQLEGDSGFYDRISYRVSIAPYRGKIRYKTLWLAFSTLDAAGWLDQLKYREILAICDEVGVGGWGNRIQDVKYLSKRIQEYRQFQKRGIVSTP